MSGIINLTPHQINVVVADDTSFQLPASGKEVRLDSLPQKYLYDHNDIPVYSPPQYDRNIVWPEVPSDTKAVVVSMPVGQLVMELSKNPDFHLPFDVLGPDTGPASVVRSATGQITGTKRLICYYRPPSTKNENQ